jgi:hypothetical protein
MPTDRLILCGPVSQSKPPVKDSHPVRLDAPGSGGNVNLRLEALRRELWRDIPPALRDLLDLALYVYCADQATTRANGGRVDGPEIGRGWRRRLFFRAAVRLPELWNGLCAPLTAVLSFLSEDEYHFEFVKLKEDYSLGPYLDFEETPFTGHVEDVVMFSGGLDALGGAVQEALIDKRQVLLVHHRSTSKRAPRHEQLVADLGCRAGSRAPLHFPIWANKEKGLAREYTQRTRSFVFAALGGLFAGTIGLDRVRFYENGVVSLNLPPSPQIVGSRASRTTHPRVLDGFSALLTAVIGRSFRFENPFLWKTKTDVVQLVRDAGCADMIGSSTSCGHTWELTREHTHCGMCSQCIDRRLAVLAAGMGANDPAHNYRNDPVLGAPPNAYAKTMVTAYMELVERVERMNATDFVSHFGEVARVLRHVPGGTAAAALQVYQLYRRHAEQVRGAVNSSVTENVDAVTRRTLPRDCLLRLVYDRGAESGVAAAPPPPPARPEGNYFTRRGEYWVIRFGTGDEKYYNAQRGFDYLRILLEHTRASHTAADLAGRVGRQHAPNSPRTATLAEAVGAGVGALAGSEADDALDDVALVELLARLERIEKGREVVEASDSPTRLDELEELEKEERAIRKQLDRDRGLRGKVRPLGDVRNQLRNRVCNAIRRALVQIDKYDKPLATHLTPPTLTLGHSLRYQPDSTVTWAFAD